MERIGLVKKIMRYPVKSMMGEELHETFVSFSGITGDRVYAFVDKSMLGNFPWMSARQNNSMILYKPKLLSPPKQGKKYPSKEDFSLAVIVPFGETFPIESDELRIVLEKESDANLELRFSERGMHDSRPVSFISYGTLKALGDEMKIEMDERRFRANFYIYWDNKKPFFEDTLLGKKIQIGEKLILEIVKKDSRCVIITLNPDDKMASPEILENVAKNHGGCVGVYAAVINEGIVREGDKILLLD
jgi:uncharacterized protein YcbX